MNFAYVVRGSEDGNLGVFTSKKRATMRAVMYCSVDNDEFDENVEVDTTTSSWMVYVEGNGMSADVEKFEINEY